ECSFEVCQKSDAIGSTEFIQTTLRNAESGSRWLVGTELNLVNRLHEELKENNINVHFMSPITCMCSTMYRIDPQHLAWTLENLCEDKVVNQITVPAKTAHDAKLALNAMLQV
ncbi:MAG TPA: quinolinate synthase NadA, partial [Gammaproteobacteria bacterium]|nr:quinolinate synthase NadA [Gammaproteobacteria bacterium]